LGAIEPNFDIVISQGGGMAQLVVRNLEDDVKARLQDRAKRHKRSLEEEIRDILRAAALAEEKPRRGLGSEIAALFKDVGFEEGEIQELRGHPAQPAKFDE
jgi:plasmid stability protein